MEEQQPQELNEIPVGQLAQATASAEAQGLSVDWKQTAYRIHDGAVNAVKALTEKIDELEHHAAEHDNFVESQIGEPIES
jgi:hypothetical protein